MNLIGLIAIAMLATTISVMIKKYNPEYSILISIVAGIFILCIILGEITPAMQKIKNLISTSKISYEHAKILFKTLGICFLVQFASDSCNDAGESSLASKIEFAGKILILTMALPLFEQVIKIVSELLGG